MALPKIKFSALKRTSLSCPSQWEITLDDGSKIRLHFRHGKLNLFINDKQQLETSKDDFDISGYLSDEDLYTLLAKHEILDEQ
jgi:hypothetical protein